MIHAPIITFYSFKGGVGRTLAMLGVARHLARAGNRVLCVDFDLEAPGLAWEQQERGIAGTALGISDLIFKILDSADEIDAHAFVTRWPDATLGAGPLNVITAGTCPADLSHSLTELFADPASPVADAFRYTFRELSRQLNPDFILLDSRTGLADIAGVCTLELPDLVVALSSLNAQSVRGMEEDFLRRWLDHEARRKETAMLLVASPVHDPGAWGEPALKSSRNELAQGITPSELLQRQRPLWARYTDLQARLLAPLLRHAEADGWFKTWPGLDERRMFHHLSYDPKAALGEVEPDRMLDQEHQRLAHVLSQVRPGWGRAVSYPHEVQEPLVYLSGLEA